ncbi:MAG: MBG domain-containing protein, partial [Gemmatimonadaceae bacterium]
MRTFVTRVVLLLGATAAVAGTTAAVARQVAAPQKALVYCPVGVDAAGCTAIQATLAASPAFTGGVDLGYDGSSGTVDLAAVDLAQYAVVVVPSLAADDTRDPYAVLRSAAVQGRLRVGLTGRVAVWAGTPDLGSANRAEKDQLLRNLAAWGARDWPLAGSTGLVALADLSADAARRYDWLAGVSRLHVAADGELYSFDAVTPVTGTAKEILKKADGTTPLAYANMASFGLSVADGSTGGTLDAKASTTDASGATVTETVLITAPGGNNTGGASLATDKGDYTPGETVTFTGGGWTAGETVTITVHENPTEHEDRTLTAVADSEGRIRNAELVMEPHHLGVTFYVTARGGTSGLVAQTSFTDGGVTVKAGPVNSTVTFNLTVADYKTSGTCSGTPSSITSSISVNATTAYVNNGLGNGQSYKLTASANATSAPNGAFQGWQRTGGSAPVTTIDAFSICVAGPNQADLVATYANASPATSLAVGAAAGTYGGTTTLTATLIAGGSAVSGQSVTFTLNGAGVGSATTNGSGVATLSSVPLGTINAGSYPAGVGASFSGSTTPALTASNGTASLTVNKAPLSVTANNASRAYGAANPALTGTLSGVVAGDAISASFVTTATQASPAGSYPITPVLADAGSRLGNYNVTSTNGTLTVGKATLTVTPNGASRAYGEANPELSGTITGLLAGDNIGATYATTATETSPVGTYDITATLVDPDSKASNYIVTLNKGTLTVGKAKITVTAADAQRAYGAANPPLTGTFTGVA